MDFRSWVSMPTSSFTGDYCSGVRVAATGEGGRARHAWLRPAWAGRSAAGRLRAPERHDRRAGPRHEPALLVHDVALDQPDRPAALHDAARGGELPRPDWL